MIEVSQLSITLILASWCRSGIIVEFSLELLEILDHFFVHIALNCYLSNYIRVIVVIFVVRRRFAALTLFFNDSHGRLAIISFVIL